jgi:UDP-N-acetylglucosamine 1-carboxyvinyltransferase
VSGAKNSATRLLAAALLADQTVNLANFPTRILDAGVKAAFARKLGASIVFDHENERVKIDATDFEARPGSRSDFDLPIRTTYLLAAPQIVKSGIARVPYPGGCPIGPKTGGSRGYDLHVMVWKSLGAEVTETADHIEVRAPHGFIGADINFPISTVGGTENALMCAAVAKGRTEIANAYITPEIEDLIELLRRMGASIVVHGTSHIVVEGRAGRLSGANMNVMADRIEALTWIVFSILAGGELVVEGVPFAAMEVPLLHLSHAGIDLFRNSTSVIARPECLVSGQVQPFEVSCGAHPGVISDMQPLFALLALAAAGTSRIYDYRYPDRIGFVAELAKLTGAGALKAERGKIVVNGPVAFRAGVANSTDLRGSMAAVIAAFCAPGQSRIDNIQMALRGYNDLASKLLRLGLSMSVLEHEAVLGATG